MPSYSIAEARNRFAEIIHSLRRGRWVEVTRRGRPVAVLISIDDFERLRAGNTAFAGAYETFRGKHDLTKAGIEPEVFADLRDQSAGREMSW